MHFSLFHFIYYLLFCFYRETPTAAGPNSFGKGRLGFVDRNKAIERDIQKQLEDLGET